MAAAVEVHAFAFTGGNPYPKDVESAVAPEPASDRNSNGCCSQRAYNWTMGLVVLLLCGAVITLGLADVGLAMEVSSLR